MSHGCDTSGSISCCLRGEFTILLKVCRPEKVWLGAFRARNTEDISLIGGEDLVLEMIIRELHENYALSKNMEWGLSGFKKAALSLMNESRMWVCLILQTCPRVTPLRDIKDTALNTLLHWFYQVRGNVASDCYLSVQTQARLCHCLKNLNYLCLDGCDLYFKDSNWRHWQIQFN